MKRFAKSRPVFTGLLGLVILFLTGCAPSVVGKWKGDLGAEGQQMPVRMEFRQDGTLSQKITAPLLGDIDISGDYTVSGDKMTLNLSEATAKGKTIPVKGMGAASGTLSIKFEGDKLILTSADHPLTLERVKE